MEKKNLVFEKFGIGKRRKRVPLHKTVIAILRENFLRHKEWLRRGESFKNNSDQRFGE